MGNMFTGLFWAVFLVTADGGAPALLTAKEHPWGSFLPNSWRIVQTVTISNIDGRPVQSQQTIRTTHQSIDESGITLQKSETLVIGGRNVEKNPQNVKYDFFQEPIQENVRISAGESVKLTIGKKVVPCAVRIYEQQTSSGRLTTTIWYTPHVFPYILRVEKILRSSPEGDNAGGRIIRQTVTLVQTTSALQSLRGNRRNRTYTLQTVEKAGNITRITDSHCSWDVPGGLLESTTREFDDQNREVRRSVSRMTNYFSYEVRPSMPLRYRSGLPLPVDVTY